MAVEDRIDDKVEFLSQGYMLSRRIRYLEMQCQKYGECGVGGRRPGRGSGFRTNAGFTRFVEGKVSVEQDLRRAREKYDDWYVLADEVIDAVPDYKARMALKLRYLELKSHEAIAEELGCDAGKVGGILEAGRRMLRLPAA